MSADNSFNSSIAEEVSADSSVGNDNYISNETSMLIYAHLAQLDNKDVPNDSNVRQAITHVQPRLEEDKIVQLVNQQLQRKRRAQEEQEIQERLLEQKKNVLEKIKPFKMHNNSLAYNGHNNNAPNTAKKEKNGDATDVLDSFVSSLSGNGSINGRLQSIAFRSSNNGPAYMNTNNVTTTEGEKRNRDISVYPEPLQRRPSQNASTSMNSINNNNNHENTHVYLDNLPSGTTEEAIIQELGVYGDIKHIRMLHNNNQINTHDTNAANTSRAIVSFRTPEQAQDAILSNGQTAIQGTKITIKASYITNAIVDNTILATRASVLWSRSTGQSRHEYISTTPITTDATTVIASGRSISLKYPSNLELISTIDVIARYVAEHGPQYEEYVKGKKKFPFLDITNVDHNYYRWRVRCYILKTESHDPYQPVSLGVIVFPPSLAEKPCKQKLEEASILDQIAKVLTGTNQRILTDKEIVDIEQVISNLNGTTVSVAKCTMKCVRYGESAITVLSLFYKHIKQTTDSPLHILYGLSDLLYNTNSNIAHVTNFLQHLESTLETLMDILLQIYKKMSRALEKTSFQRNIIIIFELWVKWGAISKIKIASFLTQIQQT